MPLDRREAAHQYIDYLWDTRHNGRWTAMECLFSAWQREARAEYYICFGHDLAVLAERRRSATVIDFAERRQERRPLSFGGTPRWES